jgi:RNA polymerase sigma-70 factor (ECF subfamily)
VEVASVEELNTAMVTAYPDLLRRAAYLTRDRGEAMELVQRTVERACAARAQLKAGSNAVHWLGAILTTQFINEFRRHRASPFIYGAAHENVAAPLAEAPPPWSSHTLDDVIAAARRLPDGFREPFELHMLRGLSHRALALRLGLPMGTVATRIHRAKLLLRGLLSARAQSSWSASPALLEGVPDDDRGVEVTGQPATAKPQISPPGQV